MPTYFHIGYPKAGSSALQKGFFAIHPQINFLGRIPLGNTGTSERSITQGPFIEHEELRNAHDQLVTESPDLDKVNEAFSLIQRKTKKDGQVSVLSSEFVTGIFFNHPDIEEKIKRVKKIGVDGIILVIRNQVDLILSQYREHPFDPADLIHGAPMSPDEWVRKSQKLPYNYLKSLKYHHYLQICIDTFGKNNVLTILFEDLISHPERVARQVSNQLDIDFNESLQLLSNLPIENQGVSARYNRVRNFKKHIIGKFPISKFVPSSIVHFLKEHLKRGTKASYTINNDTIKLLNEYFEISNKSIASDLQLDLKELNYPPYYTPK